MKDVEFDPNLETKIICHGWNSDGFVFTYPFVEAYFGQKEQKINIIAIEYASLVSWDNYFVAATNVIRTGEFVAQNLAQKILVEKFAQDPNKIHIIGHSLGAHMAGHMGRSFKNSYGKSVKRITGKFYLISSLSLIHLKNIFLTISALDPAKPWFDFSDSSNRLSKEDAQLVDVIHTNSGDLLDVR